jgi:hypothetical protein
MQPVIQLLLSERSTILQHGECFASRYFSRSLDIILGLSSHTTSGSLHFLLLFLCVSFHTFNCHPTPIPLAKDNLILHCVAYPTRAPSSKTCP